MKSIRLILRAILYIYIAESFYCIPESDIVNQLQLKKKKKKVKILRTISRSQ